jgi:DtxR family Mn-dependent transcriptional regulator
MHLLRHVTWGPDGTNDERRSVSDLIDTTEMYLRTIYELAEEGIVPLRARIAERLGHSGPTVSQTVARMERDGLVVVSGDRHLELTDSGHLKATRVMRKHRLAERLLTDVIGLEWSFVHDEACRWEHVMSDRVERRLIELLDHPHHSPYGNPIPGLAELGEDGAVEGFLDGVVSLVVYARALAASEDAPDVAQGVRIARLGEPLQTDIDLLERLSSAGVLPGATVTVERGNGIVTVGVPGADVVLDLPDDVARHMFVTSPAA